MRKNIILALVIFSCIVGYIAYRSNINNNTQRENLINACKSIEINQTVIAEVDRKFLDFYQEQVSTNSSTSKKIYGISKSRFDSFCVVIYNSDNIVIESGISYD